MTDKDRLNRIIVSGTERIFEQSVGIKQQEITRIIKKIILLTFELLRDGVYTVEEMIEELKDG